MSGVAELYWEYIDKKFQWAAMDKSNDWFAFTAEPDLTRDMWWPSTGEVVYIAAYGSDLPWDETKTKRP